MDQKQLTYFIAVAKYRNFSRAAQDFYLTQPAISHQIKMLEKELDTELFVRNTKKVTLTDSGELFLEDAKSILDAMGQAKQKLDLAKEQPSVLRISHLSAPTHQFLPEVVNQFHIRYPHIKIKLMRQDALQISETAARQDADIYYSMMPDLQQISTLDVKKSNPTLFVWLLGKIILRYRKWFWIMTNSPRNHSSFFIRSMPDT